MNFMRCCRFIGLADTISGNRTLVETLVERAGCCIEKSALAAALAHHMGLTPSIIMRYSPALQTRFHAILGVHIPEPTEATPNNTAEDYCRKHEGELWYVHVGGYIGVELTKNVKHFIGSVCSWGNNCTDAVADERNPSNDTSKYGQVVIIPITSALECEPPIMQTKTKNTELLGDAHWKRILEWDWKM
jgi:hypothetical protein